MISIVQTRMCAFGALLALCSGCVATSDLERLNRDLTKQMDSANTTIKDDLLMLGGKVDQVQTSQEALRSDVTSAMETLRADTNKGIEKLATDEQARDRQLKELESQIEKTRQALKDYVTTSSQAMEQIAKVTTEVNNKLAAIEQTVATVRGLPPAVSELGAELRALRQTLQQTYKLEEAALKHRLRALEELGRNLEPNPQQAKQSD